MVEINIVVFHLLQLTGGNQGFYKQGVELVCCIEIVGLALIRSIGDVFLCQVLDGSEDGIRAACAPRSDDTRDGALDAMLHSPRMSLHRSTRSSANGQSRCIDSR